MNYDEFGPMARVALGKADADLVLKNARVVNVFTDEILPCDIAIQGGMIVGLGCYAGREQVELQGRYVCPGFIDAHLHFESALVTPAALVNAAVRWGTTSFIADPHEAVNVAGEDGLDYILGQIEGLENANVFVMLPSCVPVTDEEENGCDFSAERMERYLHHPKVLGLGEVMDYVAVTEAAPDMMNKLALFKDRPKDGHAPLLGDKQLAAYALAKIRTDHECVDYAYALKQARNGMQVLIREGSGARNLDAIVGGIVADRMNTSCFSFCTDDKHIEDIEREGHISYNIKRSIQLGVDPIQAIKMATVNTANCYHLDELGAVAPGYRADLVILNDLADVAIHSVYCAGRRHDPSRVVQPGPCKPSLRHSVHIAPIDVGQLALSVEPGENPMIEMTGGQITTRMRRGALPARDGLFAPNGEHNKAVVVERHRATGHIGVAPVVGFHLKNGAIATSVSHDSHNIIAIGDSDAQILRAIRELERAQGGYAIVRGASEAETLALPIMGLMSDAAHGEMARTLNRMIRMAHEMGVPADMDPFVALSFLALTVIPEVRVTTRGMYDVAEHRWL